MERWKIIDGDWRYEISDHGRVKRNLVKGGFRILKTDKGEYFRTTICTQDIKKRYPVHRLVAMYFIDNPNDYRIVLHLDNDRYNNHYLNLRWGTNSQNLKQSYDDKRRICIGENNNLSKLTSDQVMSIRSLYKSGKYPQHQIGKMFGIHQAYVSEIIRGLTWKHI